MRRITWGLLLVFAFAVPWEYSLDLGKPLGNIARLVGLFLLLIAIPAVLQSGRLRAPGPMQWLTLALFLWLSCTLFWTIDPLASLVKLRGFFQAMMIVWLAWEFAESPRDLRALLRAVVAGSSVLAILTIRDFTSLQAIAAAQIRFSASGQDPNDVARFLDLAFPFAALLLNSEPRWPSRLLAAVYFPLGLAAVLLTASRGGFLAAVVALAGSAFLLAAAHPRRVLAGFLALPALLALLWFTVPHGTFARLATIPEQLQRGSLNDRVNIWIAGWHAFLRAPFFGSGAGTFVAAAHTAPIDTAHNTILAISVTGGLVALFLASTIIAAALWSITQARAPVKIALAIALLVWLITSLVATVEENRSTWLLFALIALAGRITAEYPEAMALCFSKHPPKPRTGP